MQVFSKYLYFCEMVLYEDGKKNRQTIVLLKNEEVIATFGNLKKVFEYLKDENDLPSYWTIARKQFPFSFGEYRICKVKHY